MICPRNNGSVDSFARENSSTTLNPGKQQKKGNMDRCSIMLIVMELTNNEVRQDGRSSNSESKSGDR
jgi:phage regulator Rha-like protein